MNKPQLADVNPLPVHPTMRDPITGAPVQALGFRRNGAPIWPVRGGSQPFGGPAAGAVQPQAGQPGGQQPVGQFVPGLGGTPVPVLAPGALPPVPQQPQAFMPGVFGGPGQQMAPQQQMVPQQPYGQQPQGVMPGMPFAAAGVPAPFYPVVGQPPMMFGQPAGQPQGMPGQQQPGQQSGHGQPGQQPGAGQQGGQAAGQQQPQGGGQQQSADGVWDKPYPQKPLSEMNDAEQNAYWKYHNRKLEDRIRTMGDYDQIKTQLTQLQQMTQTEWQRAVLEAENRGRSSAMEQAAGQMVAVAFQGAANNRMTPDQIAAHLNVVDARRFVHNGQVDIAAIHAYVDTIAPQRNTGLVPLLPAQQGMQQLPLQQVQIGQPGQPLMPGQPGYGQQPTFGPLGQQQGGIGQPGTGQSYVVGVHQAPGQPPQIINGQVVGQQAYGQQQMYGQQQVPVPGVPHPYQPAAAPMQPVVQSAGLGGLPGLTGRGGLPGAPDFGQGPAVPAAPANAAQSGSAMAAARHGGLTRSQQLAATRR